MRNSPRLLSLLGAGVALFMVLSAIAYDFYHSSPVLHKWGDEPVPKVSGKWSIQRRFQKHVENGTMELVQKGIALSGSISWAPENISHPVEGTLNSPNQINLKEITVHDSDISNWRSYVGTLMLEPKELAPSVITGTLKFGINAVGPKSHLSVPYDRETDCGEWDAKRVH